MGSSSTTRFTKHRGHKQEPSIKADMLQEDEMRGKATSIEIARRFLSE